MHKLMSGLGISGQTELLSFLCKGEGEEEICKISKYMKTVQLVHMERKSHGNQISVLQIKEDPSKFHEVVLG